MFLLKEDTFPTKTFINSNYSNTNNRQMTQITIQTSNIIIQLTIQMYGSYT